MPAQRFVFFDFDGVIADSLALAHDVARIVHRETDLSLDDYRELFMGNVYHSLERTGRTRKDGEYFDHYSKRMDLEVGLVGGMDAVVRTLAATFTLVIISSTTTPLIRTFLQKHALSDYFAEILGSDVHPSKVEKMKKVFERFGTASEHCVFITDTLGDIREASEHQMGSIAVEWGWHDRRTLEQGMPFRIVNAPSAIPDAVTEFFENS